MSDRTPGEEKAVGGFKAKAKEFWTLWESLNRKAGLVEGATPKLQAEYDLVMDRGLGIRKAVEKITSIIDSGGRMLDSSRQWIRDRLGLGGMEDQLLGMVPGMGALPLIPIATIGISLAAIGKWMKDAYVVDRKLNLLEKLRRGGMSAEKAANVVDRTVGSKGIFAGSMKIGAPLIVAVLVGYLYFKKGKL